MVKLRGGKFRMGTDSKDAKDGEGPSKLVQVKPFLIDKFPVTNEHFRTFVREKKYKTDAEKFGWSFAFFSSVPKKTLEKIKQSVQVCGPTEFFSLLNVDSMVQAQLYQRKP